MVQILIAPLKCGLGWRYNETSLISSGQWSPLPSSTQITSCSRAAKQPAKFYTNQTYSNSMTADSLPRSKHIKLIPAVWLQSSLSRSKHIKLIPAVWLQSSLSRSKHSNSFPHQGYGAAYQIQNIKNYSRAACQVLYTSDSFLQGAKLYANHIYFHGMTVKEPTRFYTSHIPEARFWGSLSSSTQIKLIPTVQL